MVHVTLLGGGFGHKSKPDFIAEAALLARELKAPVKVVEKWKSLVKTYLRGRQVLARNLVLVDSRHGLKEVDRDMMKMLDEAAVGYRIVLTKADKIKASELAKTVEAVEAEAKKHVAAYPEIHVTSAEKGMGIPELRAAVLRDAGV